MPGISRVNQDKAEDLILGGGQSTVYVENKLVAVIDDAIKPHPGGGPHLVAKIKTASPSVFVNGKAVARQGDKATCDHILTGSSTVFVN